MSQMLINERPLFALPSLITLVGTEAAIILQQIHFALSQPKSGIILDDGQKYVWNTYEDWCNEYFPCWTAESVRPRFRKLEEMGLLVSRQPKKAVRDRTKYYRVNYDTLANLMRADSTHRTVGIQRFLLKVQRLQQRLLTETTAVSV